MVAIENKNKIYEIVRTRDLKSFYVIEADGEKAVKQFYLNLNESDYDKDARVIRDAENADWYIVKHRGDVYCLVIKDEEKSESIDKKWYCVQYYYDNGKVRAYVTDKKEGLPKAGSYTQADIYVDEFNSFVAAKEFEHDASRA